MSSPADPVPPQSQANARSNPLGFAASLTTHERCIMAALAGLFVCFFAPWASNNGLISGASFRRFEPFAALLWAIPSLAVATGLLIRKVAVRRRLGTATAIAAWLGVAYFSAKAPFLGFNSLRWGASFTVLFALGLFVLSGERRFTMPADLVAKRLNSRKAEVYSHWGTLTPEIHFPTQEFYQSLETAIQAKQWPGVVTLRVEYNEGGLLSHGRQYFRVIRQRQLFDVCAATFGTDYFFTLREAEIPSVVTVRVLLATILSLIIVTSALIELLGLLLGLSTLVFLTVFGLWFLLNVLKLGLTHVDSLLIKLPVLGVVYEAWFRKDTYFQQDTRTIFLQSISELVKQKVDETTSAKGLKMLRCFERAPVMDGLYKQSWRSVEPSPQGA